MTITENSGESRTLKDLLVGEVWMASGQSNMQWIAAKCSVQNLINQLKEKGETPPIREFEVTSVYAALHPIEHATGAWKVNDYGNYSAIAFAFALKTPSGTRRARRHPQLLVQPDQHRVMGAARRLRRRHR